MPKFEYIAMDARGKERKGRVDADTEQDAGSKLKGMGLYPTKISQARSKNKKAGGKGGSEGGFNFVIGSPVIKKKEMPTFTRQLATLLDAGLPLVRALRTLEKQCKKDPLAKRVMGDLANGVEGGGTFSEALASHPKTFTKLYVNMVRAGEASGAMEQVLNRLAEFMEKAARIAGKVKSALMYPVVVFSVAMLITSGLMIFIVPKFAQIFAEMLPGEPLPGLTRFVLGISTFMTEHIVVSIALVIGLFIALKLFRKTKAGALTGDYIALNMPPINQLTTKTIVARFCRTLGTLMQSGVAVLQALQISRDTCGNAFFSKAIQTVHDAVKEGEKMNKPLESCGVFPDMVVSMIEVGEETGALPEMLVRIADNYEEEVDRTVEALTSLIEPMMIVFLAVIIGGIVLALFLPLIKLVDMMGGA